MLVYLFSANVVLSSGFIRLKGGFDLCLGQFKFGLVALFFGACSKVHGEGRDEDHGETSYDGGERPQEFGTCVNGKDLNTPERFIDGFGRDAGFRCTVSIFNNFDSNDRWRVGVGNGISSLFFCLGEVFSKNGPLDRRAGSTDVRA